MSRLKVRLDLGHKGAIQAAAHNDVVIVVDVLRASTTIVALFTKGVKAIKPLQSIKNWSGTAIGENDGIRLDNCKYNNSPSELMEAKLNVNQVIGLKTTNGSKCIISGKGKHNYVLIGAALNATACAQEAYKLASNNRRSISIILAGTKGKLSLDDLYVGSLIFNHFPEQVQLTGQIKPEVIYHLYSQLLRTDSAKRLQNIGYGKDVAFCSVEDSTVIVPHYNGKYICLLSRGF